MFAAAWAFRRGKLRLERLREKSFTLEKAILSG
jgi:hypothetical protein